ncbi:hypothetical protein B0H11DRAFT_619634 [Mycena galericulata]|nr:hypothetical protein B0H11DRAFT_619634 [Mycena galericulata]
MNKLSGALRPGKRVPKPTNTNEFPENPPQDTLDPTILLEEAAARAMEASQSGEEKIRNNTDMMWLTKKVEGICGAVPSFVDSYRQHSDAYFEKALRELVIVIEGYTQFMVKLGHPTTFWDRVAGTSKRANSKQLRDLDARLTSSRVYLDRASLVVRSITAENMAREMKQLWALKMIDSLGYIEMGTAGMLRCKEGEYAAILAHIKSWATSAFQDGVDKNIFWLRGPAGCGKSKAVATFFDDFLDAHHIGCNLFFDEYRKKDPALAMQTLATQLGMQFQYSCQALTHAIGNGIAANPLIMNCSLEEQLDTLVLQPLLAHAPETPLVFLVDGIEWCGHGMDADSARKQQGLLMEVLRVLLEGSAHFPPNVRLLISSREDERVRDLLGDCRRVAELEMEVAVKPEPLSRWERWDRV